MQITSLGENSKTQKLPGMQKLDLLSSPICSENSLSLMLRYSNYAHFSDFLSKNTKSPPYISMCP